MEQKSPFSSASKMDKETFMSIFDDGISVRRHNEVLTMIQERFQYIMETMFRIQGAKLSWYDFDNFNNEGGEDNDGQFEPYRHRHETGFTGEWLIKAKVAVIPELERQSFPNCWYYEDFEQSLVDKLRSIEEENERKKETAKKRKEERKEKESAIILSIRSKLSDDEIGYLKKHKIKI